ncbi:hypothetical protein BC941DRAFT_97960 [Chlamydoabsidia padenii]|nr:hypothetical protein BC941DRAFT_97960 [Chlamydoabsidia padenii]
MATAFAIAPFFFSSKAYCIPFRERHPFSQFVASDKKELHPWSIGRYRFYIDLCRVDPVWMISKRAHYYHRVSCFVTSFCFSSSFNRYNKWECPVEENQVECLWNGKTKKKEMVFRLKIPPHCQL